MTKEAVETKSRSLHYKQSYIFMYLILRFLRQLRGIENGGVVLARLKETGRGCGTEALARNEERSMTYLIPSPLLTRQPAIAAKIVTVPT